MDDNWELAFQHALENKALLKSDHCGCLSHALFSETVAAFNTKFGSKAGTVKPHT